jgi:hypothetical protein
VCILNSVMGGRETYRTSIVRVSEDARRARSFSTAGGSSGMAVLPFAPVVVVVFDDDDNGDGE